MKHSSAIDTLLGIMVTLRDPQQGCPWDQKQTFDSIVPCTLEETYEVIDAIEHQDWSQVKEELGDLLFQIVFYSQMAKEQQLFDFEEVAQTICDKLIRRHPHVFGAKDAEGNPLVAADWEGIKARERAEKAPPQQITSVLDDIPQAQPALSRARKIQQRCARVGFDWNTLGPVVDKVKEELDEVMEEALMADIDQERVDEEIGDLLFAVVNLARHLGTEPELALKKANHKFERRFRLVEQKLRADGKTAQQSQLDELEALWQAVKREE